ncbi:hypothetical protein HELRODRAFT_174052 [Helobdella robusta]|uniref:Uncharacterized protein n=1 Tax=Helobdella robusta TaxID=6412 RepID=T1F7J3_HELRO|nr:hypothetical protein HELRODRAFT_174052 [Helobdella robusta]ESO03157.1 hypothetical protein HELRODRAFT_174052 [Helobdella robusta]
MHTAFENESESKALLLCSLACASSTQCIAFNFYHDSYLCETFDSKPRACFIYIENCSHRYLASSFNRNLSVNINFGFATLYIDGEQQPNISNWNMNAATNKISVPFNAKVIAIEVLNFLQKNYIQAFSDDGYIKTDTTWRCSTLPPTLDSNNNNWFDPEYDDSSWPPAINVDTNFKGYYGSLRIWADNRYDAFCRKNLCI